MYLIPLAAVALASCSNESTDSQQARSALNNNTALNIFPSVQGTTRGTVFTDANLTEFHVEAEKTGGATEDKFFSVTAGETLASTLTSTDGYSEIGSSFNKDVKLDGGKWIIESGKDYYWSSKGMQAKFTAYAPKDITTSYTVKSDINEQQDIIVAYNEGTGADFTSGVPLNFQHVMSQVVIKALNKDASANFKIEVAGVKFSNLKNASTLSFPTSSTASGTFSWSSYTPWATPSGNDTYKTGSTDAKFTGTPTTLSTVATNLTTSPFLLMPQTIAKADLTATPVTGAYLSILVRITEDGTQTYPKYRASYTTATCTSYAYVAVPVDIDWKPGYRYTYTLNFSKGGVGKVDPSQPSDEWNNKDTTGYPVGDDNINPGQDIKDSPVKLFFTVTVDDWTDAANAIDM